MRQTLRGWWRWKRFKHQRRHFEYLMFIEHNPRWYEIMQENELFGIWKSRYNK